MPHSLKTGTTVACLLIVLAWALLAKGPSYARMPQQSPTLQAGLRQTVYQLAPHTGRVERASDHIPLSGASIRIPALGYQADTDRSGIFTLPRLPEKPVIALVRKPGYATAALTLDNAILGRGPLRIALKAVRNRLVLDDALRHLGDGSYSPVSAGASDFRQAAAGPMLSYRFTVKAPLKTPAILEIGSVIGLDTLDAHRMGQSRFHRFSTPVRILLNGRTVGEVSTNGDGHRFVIPAGHFRSDGENVLQIATGFKVSGGTEMDFDDMELALLILDFPTPGP